MTDLKDLLRTAAAEAENVSVDGSALIPTIRRRRRVRTAAIGVGTAAAATTLALTAYAVLPGAAPVEAPVSGGSPSPASQFRAVDCDPYFYENDKNNQAKVKIEDATLEPVAKGTAWRGTVSVRFLDQRAAMLYTRASPQRYLLVEDTGKRSVVARAVSEVKPGDVPKAGTSLDLMFTVAGCGKNLRAGTYLLYQSTMASEGAYYSGKSYEGSGPIARLTLK